MANMGRKYERSRVLLAVVRFSYTCGMNPELSLRDQFLLDPDIVFLNHGSFGATPRPVFDVYQSWQRRMERQPVLFLGREIGPHLEHARQVLGEYVNADPGDVVFVPNATYAINVVARSLDLGPEDEVLTTNHEYGACDNAWQYMAQRRGFRYVQQQLSLPLTTPDALVEELWRGITPRTRVIFISHITSPTAVRFPIEAICARAREAGILTVIDGAHALGQVPLDMAAVGADFYTSNAHKWLGSPKGAAFLYAHPDVQHLVEPLAVGWGWGPNRDFSFGSDFIDYLQWTGTDDYSAFLSVPAAIEFQAKHDWPQVQAACHQLVNDAIDRVATLSGLPSVYPSRDRVFYEQMAIMPVPDTVDLKELKRRLYDDFRVEIPCILWQGKQFVRVSVQGYNSPADVDALVNALEMLLPELGAADR